ncbi:hypothetical protein Tco_0643280, partial [Tanacetum coccineum]
DVHPDDLCPPNKRYDLMDANKKVELEHFWHTLKEDGSKHQLTLTMDDFRTIFHLPQANDNNHASFVPPPSFSDMPWQTLCKIFSKCLTTRVTGWDQPPLQIMQMQPAQLTPHVLVPSAEKADEMILQDMIQEIEKLVEDLENVDDSSPPRHEDTSIPDSRLEPRSDKESPEVEIV